MLNVKDRRPLDRFRNRVGIVVMKPETTTAPTYDARVIREAKAIEEHLDKQEPIVVHQKDAARFEEALKTVAKEHGQVVLYQSADVDQDYIAFRWIFSKSLTA